MLRSYIYAYIFQAIYSWKEISETSAQSRGEVPQKFDKNPFGCYWGI